jgi:hypothetical protein
MAARRQSMSRGQEFTKGVWKQEPLLHTPKELTHLAKSLTADTHPDLGEVNSDGSGNFLKERGNDKESAAGECDKACRLAHDYLPHGSHKVIYDDHPRQINHFVHHVPTTEGMYAVDYTQRQFNANAKFPVVEPMAKFQARQSMKQFGTMKSKNIHLYRSDKERNIYPEQ